MGTTVVGYDKIGKEYLTDQPVPSGRMILNVPMELYKKNDGIVVYEFNIPYDQVDDGDLAIEFYYYFKKPQTPEFWSNFYKASDFYIFPIVTQVDDDGNFWSLPTIDHKKISLVGREDGWIHFTVHIEEYMWGTFTTNDGRILYNTWYFGIYSPLLNFCWDYNAKANGIPYQLEWECYFTFWDYDYFDHIDGGEFGDAYQGRFKLPFYPSFYCTFKDIRIDSIAYAASVESSAKLKSILSNKSEFIRFIQQQAQLAETVKRESKLKRQLNEKVIADDLKNTMHKIVLEIIEDFKINEVVNNSRIINRLISESSKVTSLLKRQLDMFVNLDAGVVFDTEAIKNIIIMRCANDDVKAVEEYTRKLDYSRLVSLKPEIKTDVKRQSDSYRNTDDETFITARAFASRIFYRTVETVLSLWDWLRGKIRETNNIVSFYCPIDLEIEIEARI